MTPRPTPPDQLMKQRYIITSSGARWYGNEYGRGYVRSMINPPETKEVMKYPVINPFEGIEIPVEKPEPKKRKYNLG